MELCQTFREFRERANGPLWATIGAFDGVHLGHRHVLRTLFEEAARNGATACIVSFPEHPAGVLRPQHVPGRLLGREARRCLFAGLGVPVLLELTFDQELASLAAEDFLSSLGAGWETLSLVAGEDFRFGRANQGDRRLLESLRGRQVTDLVILPRLACDGAAISASRVRELVAAGEMRLAARLLDRPFALHGTRIAGHGIGRQLGFPTINLGGVEEMLPADGVYLGKAEVGTVSRPALVYIGTRPTFPGGGRVVEAHLDGFSQETPAGEAVALFLLDRLRGDRRFSGRNELQAQITVDLACLRALQNC